MTFITETSVKNNDVNHYPQSTKLHVVGKFDETPYRISTARIQLFCKVTSDINLIIINHFTFREFPSMRHCGIITSVWALEIVNSPGWIQAVRCMLMHCVLKAVWGFHVWFPFRSINH